MLLICFAEVSFWKREMPVLKLISVADASSPMRLAAKRWTSQAGGENPRVWSYQHQRLNTTTKYWVQNTNVKTRMRHFLIRWGPPHLGRFPLPHRSEGGAVHPRVGQQRVEQSLQQRPADPAGHLWGGRPQRPRSRTRWRWVHSQQATRRRQPFPNYGETRKYDIPQL